MLQIDIHDVGHGHCAMVTAPNGRRILIDCGCNGSAAWWPSVRYAGEHIDVFVVQNMDEDHVEDLPAVWGSTTLGALAVNPSVSALALSSMKKQGGMGLGVKFLHDFLSVVPAQFLHGRRPDLGELKAWSVWNRYDVDFIDTNNLSLVTFVQYGAFTMLFTGDLEKQGWQALLRIPAFREALRSVSVLVASHHGRENGCCDEAFQFMRPDVVVFSDDGVRFETQDTLGWYRARVRGIPDLADPSHNVRRRVLTTRRDGTIRICASREGQYMVYPQGGAGSHFRYPDLLSSMLRA